ncbi:F-box protein [Aspergillus mulundensis]|uniref:F-box domain-containing protein n=1 Tax=Aspergillus mulundensis TaxID=1810919 RepID=A0A3D8RRV9_9EURO|nr:hypothetical protein DSM5745_06804 [Aspergillus mulundensis]RDW76812.1 hypothetical protein DSM5745_06804 [Aspergillus mulundensis]
MPRKRKGARGSKHSANKLPPATKNDNNSANNTRRDPLRYLPSDCLGMILGLLDISDLARCDQVNTHWGKFVHEWITLDGIRLHDPQFWALEGLAEPSDHTKIAQVFKERAALTSGRPKHCYNFRTDSRCFAVAGNLKTKGDPEDYGIKLKPLRHPTSLKRRPLISMHLSPNGYILLRTRDHPRLSTLTIRDHLFVLETGEEKWGRQYRRDSDYIPTERPLLFDSTKLYYHVTEHRGNADYLMAIDIDSGHCLYKTRLDDRGLKIPVPLDDYYVPHQWLLSRDYTALTKLGERQVIVAITFDQKRDFTRRYPVTSGRVTVFDAKNGRAIQHLQIGVGTFDHASIVASSDEEGFVIISQDLSLKRRSFDGKETPIKLDRFVAGADGKFHHQGEETVYWPVEDFRLGAIAIDPFRHLYASCTRGPALYPLNVGSLALPASKYKDIDALDKSAQPQHRSLVRGQPRQVSYPSPREELFFADVNEYVNGNFSFLGELTVHFIARDKLVVESRERDGSTYFYKYALFDFGCRPSDLGNRQRLKNNKDV